MRHETLGASGLNYAPCKYGHSKLSFRGPRRPTDKGYVACIGGSATYGKYVKAPFSQIIEKETGWVCLNLGVQNAGIDAFEKDPALIALCLGAEATVVQVSHVQNLSNRFYKVHPRRNDRFLEASTVLKALFPEVDFAEFDFTRHMLSHLAEYSPEKFEIVQIEIQEAWLARMRTLLGQLGPNAIVVRVQSPFQEKGAIPISDSMMSSVSACVETIVDYRPTQNAISAGTGEMVFPLLQREAAQKHLNSAMHKEIADELVPLIKARRQKKKARAVFARTFR